MKLGRSSGAAHAGVKVGAPASGEEQRRGGSLGGGGLVSGQASTGRRLDVVEAGTGALSDRVSVR
jgi:hypothetical protein